MDQLPSNNEESSHEKQRLVEAKEARKRAKERARSMHARIFKKNGENGATPIRANTTSHRGRVADMSSRFSFATPSSTKKKRPKVHRNASAGNLNLSIGSISELEAVISFEDSGGMNVSSISHMTGSYGSFHGSFSGGTPIVPGPSRFEATEAEKKTETSAPKMPQRGESDRYLQSGNDSNASLCLDDIIEENSSHSSCPTNETGRLWNEGTPVSGHGVVMPVRVESFSNQPDSESSFARESTTSTSLSGSSTGVSFYSAVDSSAADSFAVHQAKARCAV